MTELLQTIVGVLQYVWPFRIVEQWERGVVYVFGRWTRYAPWSSKSDWTLGPGAYVILPFFSDIKVVTVVPVPVSCPVQTITTKDGGTLTFSATAVVRVFDAALALNAVDAYKDSVVELVAALVADALASRKDTQLESARLESSIATAVDKETRAFGIEVDTIRFPNFVVNMRSYRFVTDAAVVPQAGW